MNDTSEGLVGSTVGTEDKGDFFERWKKAVGLPALFPTLTYLSDEDLDPAKKFYIGLMHQDLIVEILDRASSPLVAALVTKGHGCTTLARYVFREVSHNCVRHRLIPVRLSLEEIEDTYEAEQAIKEKAGKRRPKRRDLLPLIEETMRRGVVQSMVLHPWDRVLGTRRYAGLLGAVTPSPLTNSSTYETPLMSRTVPASVLSQVEAHRIALRALILAPKPDWESVRALSPMLALPTDELLATLSKYYGVRISLQLDLSSRRHKNDRGAGDTKVDEYTDSYNEIILDVTRAMKTLHERPASTHIIPAVLNELYFISPEGFDTLNSEYSWYRPYDEIEYPWYRTADIFAMLGYHYPPRGTLGEGGPKTDVLSAVIDSELLKPFVNPERSLTTIVDCFEENLRQIMGNWEEASYQMKSSKQQESIDKLTQQLQEVTAKVKKLQEDITARKREQFNGADQ